MSSVRHPDRRNLGTKPTVTWLEENALVQTLEDGTPVHSFALADIRRVRLAAEMAGQTSQVVLRITNAAGEEMVFGSMSFVSAGVFRGEYETFRALLTGLHEALLPHRDQVEFVEGQSLAFMITMFVLGGLIAVMGAIFFVVLFLMQENAYGLFLIPVALMGAGLMRMFWPRGPQPYDPEKYRPENQFDKPASPDESGQAD